MQRPTFPFQEEATEGVPQLAHFPADPSFLAPQDTQKSGRASLAGMGVPHPAQNLAFDGSAVPQLGQSARSMWRGTPTPLTAWRAEWSTMSVMTSSLR